MVDANKPCFRRSVALIRNFDTGNMLRWLAVYDKKNRALNFIMAERLERESFREAIMREVSWQLSVDRKRDFLASKMAQLNLEFIESLPHLPAQTHFHVAFYNVEVYRQSVLDTIARRNDLMWVTSDEICDGKTKLGIPFDRTLQFLINRSTVIQHWESVDSQREM